MAQLSTMFSLNFRDILKGAVTAVFAGGVVALYTVVTAPSFDLFSVDWNTVIHTIINASTAAFVGYIGKNFLSDGSGKVFGKI